MFINLRYTDIKWNIIVNLYQETINLQKRIYNFLPQSINSMPPIVLMVDNEDVPIASGDSIDYAVIVPEKYPYHIYGITGAAYIGNVAAATIITANNKDYKIQIFSKAGAWHDKYLWANIVLPVTSNDAVPRPSGMHVFPYVLQVDGGEQIRISFSNLSGSIIRHFQIAFHGYRVLEGNISEI